MWSTFLGGGSLVILFENSIDICLNDLQFLLIGLGLAVLGIDGCSLFHKCKVFLLYLLHFAELFHCTSGYLL